MTAVWTRLDLTTEPLPGALPTIEAWMKSWTLGQHQEAEPSTCAATELAWR